MPTYEYRRTDGSIFEIKQRITEDALQTCPTTGQAVTRMISGSAGLIFKGSGFYQTDYVRKNEGKKKESSEPKSIPTASDAKPDTPKASASDAKPETTRSPSSSSGSNNGKSTS